MGRNFSGQNLQGQSFRGQDLADADFSRADIRGTDFRNADLTRAKFNQAQAGIQNIHKFGLFWLGFIWAIIAGAATRISAGIAIDGMNKGESQIFIIVMFIIFTILIVKRGFSTNIIGFIVITATGLILLGIMALGFQAIGYSSHGITLGLLSSLAWTMAGALFWALTATCSGALAYLSLQQITCKKKWRIAYSTPYIVISMAAWWSAFVLSTNSPNLFLENPFSVSVMIYDQVYDRLFLGFLTLLGISSLIIFLAIYVGYQAIKKDGNQQFVPILNLSIIIATKFGTRFQGAKLIETDFSQSVLSFSDLRFTQLVRTNLSNAKYLHQSRLDGTILESPQIQKLVTSLWGVNLDYSNCIPKGLYLRGANLEGANLTGADLRDCDLRDTKLTGICIANWNIDHSTRLENVECNYAYADIAKAERIPASGAFQPGDFAKLFHQIDNVITLILHDGLDVGALLQTWQQFQAEHGDKSPTFRALEDKGDGVFVLKVEIDPSADRAQIHQELIQTYEQKIQQLTAQHQTEIAHRDGQLAIYNKLQAAFDRLIAPVQKSQSQARLVVLKVGSGTVQSGFPVILQIGDEGHSASIELKGSLEGNTELLPAYKQWQNLYRQSIRDNLRLEIPQVQTTNIGSRELFKDCTASSEVLKARLNEWLDTPAFRPLAIKLREVLHPSQAIQMVLQTDDAQLRQIPFHLWNLFDSYLNAEIAVSHGATPVKVSFCTTLDL
jgi:uncharacterized protein YjbI with pentapeptide repeats